MLRGNQTLPELQAEMRDRHAKYDLPAIARYRREHPELTQYEVAEQLGCSQENVSWACRLHRNPTRLERKEAQLNAKLLAVERELAADPLRTYFLEVVEEQNTRKPKRGRPFKVRNVVCHCGGAHRILPPDPVLEAWYTRYKASQT